MITGQGRGSDIFNRPEIAYSGLLTKYAEFIKTKVYNISCTNPVKAIELCELMSTNSTSIGYNVALHDSRFAVIKTDIHDLNSQEQQITFLFKHIRVGRGLNLRDQLLSTRKKAFAASLETSTALQNEMISFCRKCLALTLIMIAGSLAVIKFVLNNRTDYSHSI